MNPQLSTWTGGDCPACGEAMPAGVVRCRYCHASLVGSDGQIEAVPPNPSEHASVASSLVDPNINEFDFPVQKPAATTAPATPKRPGKKGRGRDRHVPFKAAPSHPLLTSANPARDRDAGGMTNGTHSSLVAESDLLPVSDALPAAASVSSESTNWNRVLWVVALLLFAPLCASGPVPGDPSPVSYFVPPMIHSGDEPHYLVLINSVVRDGDIDVANNYADVHLGGNQAGRKFAGWAIDHHVNWYWHTHLIHWWQAYENQYPRWNKDADGHPVPTLRTDSIHRPVNSHEYSQHPPGLAWVLAPFVWPFRKTSLLEPAVLLCSSLVTAAAVSAFFRLIRMENRRMGTPETPRV